MVEIEIFMPAGVLTGSTPDVPLSHDGADLDSPLELADARWYPIDGGPPTHRGDVQVEPDEILLMAAPEHSIPVHMTWYSIALEVGPYRVSGSLPTMPGFDPERALSRPGHTYIGLRDATIQLVDREDVESATREHVQVNRYAVERVACNLMLGFFFPGASLVPQEAVPVG